MPRKAYLAILMLAALAAMACATAWYALRPHKPDLLRLTGTVSNLHFTQDQEQRCLFTLVGWPGQFYIRSAMQGFGATKRHLESGSRLEIMVDRRQYDNHQFAEVWQVECDGIVVLDEAAVLASAAYHSRVALAAAGIFLITALWALYRWLQAAGTNRPLVVVKSRPSSVPV